MSKNIAIVKMRIRMQKIKKLTQHFPTILDIPLRTTIQKNKNMRPITEKQ